jgi:fructose-specific phosphotransferase system IIC component
MSSKVKAWLLGFLNGIVNGFFGGVAVVIVDPVKFNLTTEWKHLLYVCLIMALMAAANYLRQSPFPSEK